jgi:hypothetical protein
VRQTDHATVTGTGKIAGQTMELEYNHAWYEMHAILTAGARGIASPVTRANSRRRTGAVHAGVDIGGLSEISRPLPMRT